MIGARMVGPRVYTTEEAQTLVAAFESAFRRLDELREQVKAAKIKLTALEMIWGSSLLKQDCPDHREGVDLVRQLKELQEAVQAVIADLGRRSATVKDIELGLVDVLGVREGVLVNLCWKRGETAITTWHHVDDGYSGRQPL